MRALEFYCGIGGFAASVLEHEVEIAAAFDQNPHAVTTCQQNYKHPVYNRNLEDIKAHELSDLQADFWWMSPPCQPFTVKGKQLGLEDPRAKSFKHLLTLLTELQPSFLGFENVQGFRENLAYEKFCTLLKDLGYHTLERTICSSHLGIPNLRPRFYLLASKNPFKKFPALPNYKKPLKEYLQKVVNEDYDLPADFFKKYYDAIRIIDPASPIDVVSTCFASSYGKALMGAGSFIKTKSGARYFTPEEVVGLLGFPLNFRFPAQLSLRARWKLAGNSLSVCVLKYLFQAFPI